MTVQYEGNDIYVIYVSQKQLKLHLSEIIEIQEYNFTNQTETESVEKLELIIDKLKDDLTDSEELIYNRQSDIDDLQDTIDVLKDQIIKLSTTE